MSALWNDPDGVQRASRQNVVPHTPYISSLLPCIKLDCQRTGLSCLCETTARTNRHLSRDSYQYSSGSAGSAPTYTRHPRVSEAGEAGPVGLRTECKMTQSQQAWPEAVLPAFQGPAPQLGDKGPLLGHLSKRLLWPSPVWKALGATEPVLPHPTVPSFLLWNCQHGQEK